MAEGDLEDQRGHGKNWKRWVWSVDWSDARETAKSKSKSIFIIRLSNLSFHPNLFQFLCV